MCAAISSVCLQAPTWATVASGPIRPAPWAIGLITRRDIIVFAAGQEGSDSYYGHVAIVEKINDDGSIVTSESGASLNGGTYSRTLTNVGDFQYIHY